MMQFQHDELSIVARSLVPLLSTLRVADARQQAALDRLLQWDYVLDQRSVAAAIYVRFERRLLENVKLLLVPEPARQHIGRLNKKRVLDWLAAPDGRFGADPLAGRDDVLRRSLAQAVADLTERLGPEMEDWRYGQDKLKHVLIPHPLSRAVNAATRAHLDVGPAPRGGYDSTLNNTGDADNQRSGASLRVVMDTANWDNSVATNTPGQSGDPQSAHYRDLFELWAQHRYFPLFYSRGKIESVTERRVILEPSAR
jgi:penicillin amidase